MKYNLKKILITLSITFLPLLLLAQQGTIESAYDTLNIEGQFDHLYRRSNTYEEYKVMPVSSYNRLKANTLDTIRIYKGQVNQLQQDISTLNDTITNQNTRINDLTTELESTKTIQNSVSFLGKYISKDAYNGIMWGLVICLIAILSIVFSLYKRGHAVVKSTKSRLEEVKEEFENHRKNALTREQKLARELMDVKLKNKSSR